MSKPIIRHRGRPNRPTSTEGPAQPDLAVPHGQVLRAQNDHVADEAEEQSSAKAYRVGYKQPPLDTRFGGKRGNRSGRKKGSKTLEVALAKELKSKVEVNVGGRVRSLTKLEVLALNMVNSAIAGKPGPQRLVFAHLLDRAQVIAELQATVEAVVDEVDLSDGELSALQLLMQMFGNAKDNTIGDQE